MAGHLPCWDQFPGDDAVVAAECQGQAATEDTKHCSVPRSRADQAQMGGTAPGTEGIDRKAQQKLSSAREE